jgi:hypothetical protein
MADSCLQIADSRSQIADRGSALLQLPQKLPKRSLQIISQEHLLGPGSLGQFLQVFLLIGANTTTDISGDSSDINYSAQHTTLLNIFPVEIDYRSTIRLLHFLDYSLNLICSNTAQATLSDNSSQVWAYITVR